MQRASILSLKEIHLRIGYRLATMLHLPDCLARKVSGSVRQRRVVCWHHIHSAYDEFVLAMNLPPGWGRMLKIKY
uniref:Cytoplasmic protein n=1 Tax=Macrostomum lignano TaxID=282301 RepID=A0A1I8JQN5_9PLAT